MYVNSICSIYQNKPCHLSFDMRNKKLYVSDMYNHIYNMYNSNFRKQENVDLFYLENAGGICFQPFTNNIIATKRGKTLQVLSNEEKLNVLYNIDLNINKHEYLCRPSIDCNNRGQMIIADYSNHRVQIRDEKGRFIRQIGTGRAGNSNDQFHWPEDARVEKTNNRIHVVDSTNCRISVWSGDGSCFLHSISLNKVPVSLITDNYNKIIIGMWGEIRIFDIHKFKTIQTMENTVDTKVFTEISDLAINDNDDLIVADKYNDKIHIFNLIK